MTPTIAYLADGRLFLARPDQPPEPIESRFVRSVEERRNTHRERHGWREQGMMWNFGPGTMGGLPGGMPEVERPVRFTAVTAAAEPGQLLYALLNESVGGLFRYDPQLREEQRLVHKRGFELHDLARHPLDGRLAASVRHPNFTATLALMEPDASRLRELTAGDSLDEAPAWAPDRPATLVYQSAGIARSPDGMPLGLGPYVIHELDLDSERMTTRLELTGFDCLAPRVGDDGALFYIRRPYCLRPPVSPWNVLKDIALFPWRLGRAVVHFLNAFSLMFSRKPLLTAGGPQREGPDRRMLMLWGRWIEVQQELRSGDGDKPLVPADWVLVRRSAAGQEEELASSVISYDLRPDGGLVYTDGVGVYLRTGRAGERVRVARGAFIERVALILP